MRPIARLELLLRLVAWLSWKDAVSLKQELPSKPWSFCVTEDGLFLIPDYKTGNIKIYERRERVLALDKISGRKGFGVDDFAEPVFCFYNKVEGKFGVLDFGRIKTFLYNRVGRVEFGRINDASRRHIMEHKLLLSGYKTGQNSNPYDFYYINMIKNQATLMSYIKNIFARSKHILVIYDGPVKWNKSSNFWLQHYTPKGNFVEEAHLPKQLEHKMWLDKDKHILYSLSRKNVLFDLPRRFLRGSTKVCKEVS